MTIQGKLIVPALRAKMGDNIYYISFMNLKEIAKRISIAQDIHQNARLRELIQRQVTDRSKEISTYLIKQKQRFFNALIIGVYGGSPNWFELSIEESQYFDPKQLPKSIEGSWGILILEGNETLFAIDGQHRVAGIKHAMKQSDIPEDLPKNEVCTIFLSAKVNEPEGLERTRRLFTTLNRYAKPVSMMDVITKDEDDTIAVITRDLLEKYRLFQDHRIAISKGKMISVSDGESLTTLVTLYEVLDIILRDRSEGAWKEFKKFRPSDEMIAGYYEKAQVFWNLMIDNFPMLPVVRDSTREQKVARQFRHREGGHLLFRPVGMLVIARAIKMAERLGKSQPESLRLISQVNMEINSIPWVGVLWDDIGKRMITRKENQETAAELLLFIIGIEYTPAQRLKTKYASALNRPENEIQLPERIL
jgi:DNA sulfur modification protein DndB